MKEELINYVSNLTPEQVEKLIDHLQELSSLLEETSPPYPQEQMQRTA